MEEPSTSSQQIRLKVYRAGGSHGTAVVQWSSTPTQPWLGSRDISPPTSNLTFLSFEKEKVLVIDVEPDDVPEIDEVYTHFFYKKLPQL